MKINKLICIIILLFSYNTINAQQEYDKWLLIPGRDRFGDPNEEYTIAKAVIGSAISSTGRSSQQNVAIAYYPTVFVPGSLSLIFQLSNLDGSSLPLATYFTSTSATLHLKDSGGKTYAFNGIAQNNRGTVIISFPNISDNDKSQLLTLLKGNDKYSAVLDGNSRSWKCNFSFSGNMPDINEMTGGSSQDDYVDPIIGKWKISGLIQNRYRVYQFLPNGKVIQILYSPTGEILDYYGDAKWEVEGTKYTVTNAKNADLHWIIIDNFILQNDILLHENGQRWLRE